MHMWSWGLRNIFIWPFNFLPHDCLKLTLTLVCVCNSDNSKLCKISNHESGEDGTLSHESVASRPIGWQLGNPGGGLFLHVCSKAHTSYVMCMSEGG
jgi:hypothetical protein